MNRIKKKIKIPLIAIGGINRNNVTSVIKAGADGVAVVSAITKAGNVRKTTRELLFRISEVKK